PLQAYLVVLYAPRPIADRLLKAGCDRLTVSVWTRWNREMFADMAGLLLGGPGVLGTVMDVVGRSPSTVLTFNPRGVHPTPYFRTPITLEMLRPMGFGAVGLHHSRACARL